MNELTPALIAAGGGSAMYIGIAAYEKRRDDAMRASRVRLSLRFPTGLEPLTAYAVLNGFTGLALGNELICEVTASASSIRHALLVPSAVRSSVEATLRGVIPSIRIEEAATADKGLATVSLRVFLSTPSVLSSDDAASTSKALLSGMNRLQSGEQIVLRWALRPGGPRRLAQREPQTPTAKEADRLWRRKTQATGMRLAGLVLVRAQSVGRARILVAHIESVLRSRSGAVGELHFTSERGARSLTSLPRTTRTSGWATSGELLPLLAWPIGADVPPGVELGASRELLVPGQVPRDGRQLLVGRDAASGNDRRVALTPQAASRHLAIFGSTGAGKSSVLGRLVLDALAEGAGGVLLDPKDLVDELANRVPPEHADRVVVFDPASPGPAIGLDLFGAAAGDSFLRSDVILSALRAVSEGWGPRIDSYLRLGLQSLSALPDPVLGDWLRLYREPALRREVVARLDDAFLVAEWRAYEESLSAAEQFQHTAPAIARITNLLSRPALRLALSQPNPKLNISQLLEEGRWLLVALNPGTTGEPAARLLASIIAYLAWAAIEARATLAPAMRRPIMLALDELQTLSSLPIGLETFFERARSMNCSVVAAAQTPGRLPDGLRTAVLGNVGSLVTFRMGYEESARLSRELPGLSPQDVMSLDRFEVAARIATATVTAVVTGRTEPLPPVTGMGRLIRERSERDYGRWRGEVEAELRQRHRQASGEGPIGSPRGRS